MPIYLYRCRDCGAQLEGTDRALNDGAIHCETPIARDYRAEAVGFAVAGLRAEREHNGASGVRDLFLETAEEAAGPGDPDGAKAIEEWNERFEPAEGNKKPLRPERPLHSRKVL